MIKHMKADKAKQYEKHQNEKQKMMQSGSLPIFEILTQNPFHASKDLSSMFRVPQFFSQLTSSKFIQIRKIGPRNKRYLGGRILLLIEPQLLLELFCEIFGYHVGALDNVHRDSREFGDVCPKGGFGCAVDEFVEKYELQRQE